VPEEMLAPKGLKGSWARKLTVLKPPEAKVRAAT